MEHNHPTMSTPFGRGGRTRRKEVANHITTVIVDAIFYPGKLKMNYFIYTNTVFAQEYRHLFKGDEKNGLAQIILQ